MPDQPAAEIALTFPVIAPATIAAKRFALALCIASFAAFCALVPAARVSVPRLAPLLPVSETAFTLISSIAAGFLLLGFRRSRSRAALVLASGYLFTGLLAVPRVLSLPGLLSGGALFATVPPTNGWLDTFREGAFPLFAIGYSLLRRTESHGGPRSAGVAADAVSAIAGVVVGVSLLAILATAEHRLVPHVTSGDRDVAALLAAGLFVGLVNLVALALLASRRPYSVIDLWLLVVLWAWLLGSVLDTAAGALRLDVGSYAGRLYAVFAVSVMPVVLLVEASRIAVLLDQAIAIAEERNAALVRSREELARAQQLEAIGQLTGGVAHDFNNLLTVVIGNLELIAGARGEAEKIQRLAENAMRAAERGVHLVRQLLTYARRQIGHPQTVDLNRLIADSESLLRRVIGEAIELVALTGSRPVMARIDPAQFETALLNLVINSRDAMAGGGQILIEARPVVVEPRPGADPETKPGPYVMVAVRDSGAGMTPEVLARAFDPFFTTKEIGKGSGLGLSQVYGFAKTAGGHVDIASEPGHGTTVALYLPQSPDPPAAPQRDAAAAPPVGGDETILVVEDDKDVLAVTAECLAGLGYRVVTAGDAAQALVILGGDQRVDLLFSDVAIPGGTNGAELAIAARRLRPGLKVLLASGYTAAALPFEPGLIDDLAVVDKPFQRAELARKLKAVISD